MKIFTAYLAPSDGWQCKLYAIPHEMRPYQSPRDLHEAYRVVWFEMGVSRPDYAKQEMKLEMIFHPFGKYREEVEDLSAGSFVQIQVEDAEYEELFGPHVESRLKEASATIYRNNLTRSIR